MSKYSAYGGILLILTIAAWPLAVCADTDQAGSDDLALAVADAEKANLAALMDYTWRAKAEIAVEGETKATVLTEYRFNTEGKLEATNVGGESSIEKKHGLRGHRQKKKMEEFQEYLKSALEQSMQYIFMSKGTLVDIFDRAKISDGKDSVTVAAGDLFVKGDKLVLAVDPASNLARRLSFNTTLDKDAIDGFVIFSTIENGPNRVEHFQLDIPSKQIQIVSETYDWIKQE